jgi:tripeptide aminopeptidase
LSALPRHRICPEATSHKEGFVHPTRLTGVLEKAEINFIIRDFTTAGLEVLETELEEITKEVMKGYPNSSYEFKVTEQYRNMKEMLDQHPEVMAYAVEAIERSGMKPVTKPIRGGTDGSRLSFMGMPCPNIFTGEMAFHSKYEYVGVRDMEKAVETIIRLCTIWEEKS